MNKLNYYIFAILSLFVFQACGDDSADNPSFGDSDVPRIYFSWQKEMVYSTGDTIRLYPEISPADGATYKWTLGDKIISTEKHLNYEIVEHGELNLKFEVERKGVKNSRISSLIIALPFVPKTYNKKSVAFISINGSASDINWNDITHLIVTSSVIQPSGLPDISFTGATLNIPALITAAHNNGVYVLIEYSGKLGSYVNGATPYGNLDFYNAATSPTVRTEMIKTMLDYATATGFDGINIYMDKETVNGVYANPAALADFYSELVEAAPEDTDRGEFFLSMSAVSGWTKGALIPVVNTPGYDWINILSYGAESIPPAPHSPYSLFVSDAAFWVDQGVPKEKLIMAAPAFGLRYFGNVADYTWGNLWSFTEYRGYRAICNEYPSAPSTNVINVDNGIYYDGVNDVKEKAEHIVSENYAGMALWTIDNDNKESSKSLMKQINTSLGN